MEIRGDLLSYFTHKMRGKPFYTSLEAITKDAVSEQALGDLGIRRESRMATERLFQPINRIQGNYYVPVEEAASCQIYCQWGPGSERHIYAREHTCMPAHTHTHTLPTPTRDCVATQVGEFWQVSHRIFFILALLSRSRVTHVYRKSIGKSRKSTRSAAT